MLKIATVLALLTMLLAGCQSVAPRDQSGPPTQSASPLALNMTQLGISYMTEGRYDTAYNRLQRALELSPDYAPAHDAMGLLYERLGQPDKARAEYQRTIELDPNDPAAQNNYGSFLCRHSDPQAGVRHLLIAISNPLYRSPEIAYTNAGLCLQSVNRDKEAETYLRKALKIDPRLPNALMGMARLNYERKQYLNARAYFERFLAVAKPNADNLWLGYRIERALGGTDTMQHYATMLKSLYPNSKQTRLLLESKTQ